jgi:hypothetical protein
MNKKFYADVLAMFTFNSTTRFWEYPVSINCYNFFSTAVSGFCCYFSAENSETLSNNTFGKN